MKFSIRDLLWLMMVMGLFFAWAMDRRNMDAEKSQFTTDYREKEQALSAKDDELKQVTERLRRAESRVRYYRSGTIGFPP